MSASGGAGIQGMPSLMEETVLFANQSENVRNKSKLTKLYST
jgi:hypothetical protein